MNEQEARAIETQLTGFLPGCKIEAYSSEEPDYQMKQFIPKWMVAVYSTHNKALGSIVCVIRDKQHFNALLSMCASYYNQRKEIEEDAAEEYDSYEKRVDLRYQAIADNQSTK